MSRSTPAVARLRAPSRERPQSRGRIRVEPRLRPVAAGPVVVAAAIALVLSLTVGRGPASAAPASGAAALVPDDALAYVHVSTDPSRTADRQALALAKRLPGYPAITGALLGPLEAMIGGSTTAHFARDVRPWLGDEAALALLSTSSSTTGSLLVLDVRDRRSARAFLGRAAASASGRYRGVSLWRYPSGAEGAFVSHYLALGPDAAVRAAIDVDAARYSSLAHDPSYVRAAAGEPAGRVLDAYASQAGIQRLLQPRGGALGALGALLSEPALSGVTLSMSATDRGISIRVHSALNPALAGITGSGLRAFSPTLPDVIPSGSALMLDSADLSASAPRILAAGASIGIGSQIGPLLGRLGRGLQAEGVNVRELLSLFDGETAVAISPTASGSQALLVVARTTHPERARAELATLEAPLSQLFAPPGSGGGQAPVTDDHQLGDTTVHELSLGPALRLYYTVSDGLVVISTSLDGVAQVIRRGRALSADGGYRAAVPDRSGPATSLVFLDFSQLLSLGEQTGLARSVRDTALRADLARIRAIGLHARGGEADSTAELFLHIP